LPKGQKTRDKQRGRNSSDQSPEEREGTPDNGPTSLQQVKQAMCNTILNRTKEFCITMDSKFKIILIDLLSKPKKMAKDLFKVDNDQLMEMQGGLSHSFLS
jgi:hypothetical protein